MNRTGIDYLDYTWNPLAMRCIRVSPACDNCWHLRMAARKAGNPKLTDLERRASAGLILPVLMPDRLDEPLRLKKPRRIGVQFMGDLFHESVYNAQVDKIFEVIFQNPQHQFVLLTKRPGQMRRHIARIMTDKFDLDFWMLNLWLGITAENQAWFDRRWADLKQIPAAKVIVSYEPALGPIVFPEDFLARGNDAWLIAGGETGPHARPSHPDWFRQARDQAAAAGVPFFFKSWGEWAHTTDYRKRVLCVYNDGRSCAFHRDNIMAEEKRSGLNHNDFYAVLMSRVGKKAARRLLDGQKWDEVPTL